jgi:hypothetical protein
MSKKKVSLIIGSSKRTVARAAVCFAEEGFQLFSSTKSHIGKQVSKNKK